MMDARSQDVRSEEVIVIGAGLAGLSAAHELAKAGYHVLLLEARDRIGGRMFSTIDPELQVPIEFGAEWFDTRGELRNGPLGRGMTMRKASGAFLRKTASGWRSDAPVDDSPLQHLRGLVGPDRPLIEALRDLPKDKRDPVSETELLRYVQGFHLADPRFLSTQWLLLTEKEQSADASQVRCMEGADAFAHTLRSRCGDRLRLRLGCVVKEVRWRTGHVHVIAREGGRTKDFHAQQAIIALPLGVLQAPATARGAVRFRPSLSGRNVALRGVATGHALKVVLTFDAAFWTADPSLSKALFLQDPRQVFPTWWTARPARDPMLVGWLGGPAARRISHFSNAELRAQAVASLAAMLDIPSTTVRQHLTGCHVHNWSRDPFALGAYSYVKAGGSHAHAALAEAIEHTLYFAGEHTAGEGYNATMEGAMRSGIRAARELLVEAGRRREAIDP